jgi:hypothetical protein
MLSDQLSQGKGKGTIVREMRSCKIRILLFPFERTRWNQIWLQSLVTFVTRTSFETNEMMYKIAAKLRGATFRDWLTPSTQTTTTPIFSHQPIIPPQLLCDSEREYHNNTHPIWDPMIRFYWWSSWWRCGCVVVVWRERRLNTKAKGGSFIATVAYKDATRQPRAQRICAKPNRV